MKSEAAALFEYGMEHGLPLPVLTPERVLSETNFGAPVVVKLPSVAKWPIVSRCESNDAVS